MPKTDERQEWIRRAKRKYGRDPQCWDPLLSKIKNGRCALTGAKLLFHVRYGTPRSGHGCHPLYASVDHINPSKTDHGLQVVCYGINDLKAHLPPPLFNSLKKTEAWKRFAIAWRKSAEKTKNRKTFKELIKKGGALKSHT